MNKIRIFTDGACSVQEKIGGYAFVICKSDCQEVISGSELNTTNNRMELIAVIKSLIHVLKTNNEWIDCIQIMSDSAYVINAINMGWLENWKRNYFYTSDNKQIKNVDLWKELNKLIKIIKSYDIKLEFIKVKGHDGNEFNELCDKAAKNEIKKLKESR